MGKYHNEVQKIQGLDNIKAHIFNVENLIENNIFFIDIKNKTLTKEINDSILKLGSELSFIIKDMYDFVMKNNDLLKYKENSRFM